MNKAKPIEQKQNPLKFPSRVILTLVGRGQRAASLRVGGNYFHFSSTFSLELLWIFNRMRSQRYVTQADFGQLTL